MEFDFETLEEFADFLGISVTDIETWNEEGWLPDFPIEGPYYVWYVLDIFNVVCNSHRWRPNLRNMARHICRYSCPSGFHRDYMDVILELSRILKSPGYAIYSKNALADLLSISTSTLYIWIQKGWVELPRHGPYSIHDCIAVIETMGKSRYKEYLLRKAGLGFVEIQSGLINKTRGWFPRYQLRGHHLGREHYRGLTHADLNFLFDETVRVEDSTLEEEIV